MPQPKKIYMCVLFILSNHTATKKQYAHIKELFPEQPRRIYGYTACTSNSSEQVLQKKNLQVQLGYLLLLLFAVTIVCCYYCLLLLLFAVIFLNLIRMFEKIHLMATKI